MVLSNDKIFRDVPLIRNKDHNYQTSLCLGNFIDFDWNIDEIIEGLSAEEMNHLSKLCFKKRKESYLIGRYICKQAIGNFIEEQNFSHINISYGIHNFPVVTCGSKHNIQVSISHSDHLAAAMAFPEECPMGIDVESINQSSLEAIDYVLENNERELYMFVNLPFNHYAFILWTAKEALSKAIRTGLTVPMNFFEIEKITKRGLAYYCTYKYFIQFECVSIIFEDYVMSIAYPKNSEIDLEVEKLVNFI